MEPVLVSHHAPKELFEGRTSVLGHGKKHEFVGFDHDGIPVPSVAMEDEIGPVDPVGILFRAWVFPFGFGFQFLDDTLRDDLSFLGLGSFRGLGKSGGILPARCHDFSWFLAVNLDRRLDVDDLERYPDIQIQHPYRHSKQYQLEGMICMCSRQS